MKKLLIAVPVVCALFFTSCEKDPEVITETVTVTVTDTLTVIQEKSVAIYLEPIEQSYYSFDNSWSLYATMDYSITNLGEKKISYLTVNFEAKTSDGTTYNGSDLIWEIGVGETVSSETHISVDGKQCSSFRVKSIEITN